MIAAPTLAPDGGYFLSHDRRLLFVVIDLADAPRTFDAEHAAVLAVRRAIAGLRPEFPAVEAGVTGAPALFSDEMSTATRDGEIASLLALVFTLGLLLLAFRRLLTSCAMLVVLTLSLGWSLGVITLLVGHLTILSMMFISVVIGLGTDYGIFFLFRYREERVLGRTLLGALERTAARSGPGILLGALTAAVTFYILTTAEFQRHPRFRIHLRHRDPARVPVDGDRLPGRPVADRPLAEGPGRSAIRPAPRTRGQTTGARSRRWTGSSLSEDHHRGRGRGRPARRCGPHPGSASTTTC